MSCGSVPLGGGMSERRQNSAGGGGGGSSTGRTTADLERAERISRYKEARRRELQQQTAAKVEQSTASGSDTQVPTLP